ncbi:MAG: hypothetical protein M3R06_09255 [Chloroflexota bacterium]|nr:hypothetical protein [Chloroflexota bacterium]
MRGWVRIGLLLLMFCLTVLHTSVAIAQDATPTSTPEIPDVSLCQIAPRSQESLEGLRTAAAAATPSPNQEPLTELPAGEPASESTIAGMTDALREVYACRNAGDFLRIYSLYSEPYLQARFTEQPPPPWDGGLYDALGTPQPVSADQQFAILSLSDARQFDGGRAGFVAILHVPGANPETLTLFITFVREGDRWLIDSSVPIAPNTDSATPAE